MRVRVRPAAYRLGGVGRELSIRDLDQVTRWYEGARLGLGLGVGLGLGLGLG